MLKEGQKAPAIKGVDQNETKVLQKDYKGFYTVLYFYPKDMTPGCTTEACDFRDQMAWFKRNKVKVYGVSKDNVTRHQKFEAKHELNFPLIADTEGELCEAYKVWREKKFMGRTFDGIVRSTFIIDPKGNIAKIYDAVKVKNHVEQVIEDLKALKKGK